MAGKTGLNYYSIDTDRYQDRRIKRLRKTFGCQGVAVYDYILCEIYRVRGCFLEWDENTAFDVAEYWNLKETTVTEIVKYCASVGLFNKELLSRGIISSETIQQRYLEMCSRARRKVVIPEECRIISEEYTNNDPEDSQQSPVAQKKAINLSEHPAPAAELTENERDEFLKIFFFKNYKNPTLQVERFIDHYQATGWTRSNGVRVIDRIALARTWEPKDAEMKNRFPHPFMLFWEHLYAQLSQIQEAKEGLPLMYRDMRGLNVEGTDVRITITSQLRDYLSRANRYINESLNKYYPSHRLSYKLYEKSIN